MADGAEDDGVVVPGDAELDQHALADFRQGQEAAAVAGRPCRAGRFVEAGKFVLFRGDVDDVAVCGLRVKML